MLVGGTDVSVGGTGVSVGGTCVSVGGTGVSLTGACASVGGTGVLVARIGDFVGSTDVQVGIDVGTSVVLVGRITDAGCLVRAWGIGVASD